MLATVTHGTPNTEDGIGRALDATLRQQMDAFASSTVDPQELLRVSYDEFRQWAVVLRAFTPSDLADSMAVSREVALRGIRAMLWHGIVEDTGDELYGVDGPEPIISYVPLPPGPREHETLPPEWRTCVQDLVTPGRGLPVRIRNDRKHRQAMAMGSGGSRHQLKLQEKRYQAHLAAVERRRAKQKARMDSDGWRKPRKSKKSRPV